MIIRKATHADLDALVALGQRFFAFSRFSAFVEFDREHARSSLAALMERGVLLVAESAGCLAGAIVGLMAPLWFNPTVSVAAELGWWVDERFRGSSAGVKLARAFEQWGRDNGAAVVTMSDLVIEGEAPAGRLFEKLGYQVVERSQIKAV